MGTESISVESRLVCSPLSVEMDSIKFIFPCILNDNDITCQGAEDRLE